MRDLESARRRSKEGALNGGAGRRRRRGAASENFPCGESDCVCSRNKSVCVFFYDDNYPRHFCSRGWMDGRSLRDDDDRRFCTLIARTLSRVDLGLKANSAPFNWPSSCQSNCQNIPLICAPSSRRLTHAPSHPHFGDCSRVHVRILARPRPRRRRV